MVLIVVIGGATRLTRSGLSIVEWQPIAGVLPPLGADEWEAVFAKYRATPEYQLVNKGMSLDEFKSIFWWEYVHRLLARIVGLVFLLPFVWFVIKRRVEGALAWKLAVIFVLGALQGLMGWLMVKSGLVDDPKVSPLRLTMHLGLAFAIYAAILWVALELIHPRSLGGLTASERRLSAHANWAVVLVFVMVLSGAMVAGLRAGKSYNTFPLMNGQLFPAELFSIEPWWRNFLYNMATVQFDHRLIAYALVIVIGLLWWRVRKSGASDRVRFWSATLLFALLGQFVLGVWALLYAVPTVLGLAHQLGALVVFTAAIATAHALRERR